MANETPRPLSLVVMDPLAAPLSCPCVEGYAQRQYDKFAEALGERLGREVVVTFAESLEKALQQEQCKSVDIVVGKDSVVRADAAQQKLQAEPIALLTGKDGKTTQTGLIVVPTADPAQGVADLAGYRIIFGAADCAEKFTAARELLATHGVSFPAPDQTETSAACSDGATLILEWGEEVRGAAVISSYAAPLLEGCGTVKKGDLRVVGTTEPVPFVTAFLTDNIPVVEREAVKAAVMETSRQPRMLLALESLLGFVPLTEEYTQWHAKSHETVLKESAESGTEEANKTSSVDLKTWPGWRGAQRTGHCESLPPSLPEKIKIVWQRTLQQEGLGGIAATEDCVVVGDRDFSNMLDEFHSIDASTGEPRWTLRYPALGKLDYDNIPRATPLIADGRIYTLGAFGDLNCVESNTGLVIWRKHLVRDFGVRDKLIWGTCSSPLLVDGKLIINPGAPDAAIVACDAQTGSPVWQTPGEKHAFASPIVDKLGGVRQIVAFDRETLGGFNISTGKRLWTLEPDISGDFNVPTPVVAGERLLLTSENNGTRLYEFNAGGVIVPEPVATCSSLAPDMSTPVVVGNRLFCVWNDLYCLDLEDDLRAVWIGSDDAFGDYAPLIASDERLLVVGRGGELLLIDPRADEMKIVSRVRPLADVEQGSEVTYAYPAVVGDLLYLRVGKTLACVSLR